jgi:hypothetical protein
METSHYEYYPFAANLALKAANENEGDFSEFRGLCLHGRCLPDKLQLNMRIADEELISHTMNRVSHRI